MIEGMSREWRKCRNGVSPAFAGRAFARMCEGGKVVVGCDDENWVCAV